LLGSIALAFFAMRVCTSCRRLLGGDTPRCPDDGGAIALVEELPIGTRLGGYRIERVLGDGGMGFVYEATHEQIGRRSAIKMLRPELSNNPQIVTRFLNEAKAVNVINHQNIVGIYDFSDRNAGGVYFIMEYLEGETLDDLMRRRRPMPVPLLLYLFAQIAKALAAAHAKAIVHRDLKPANVFVVSRQDNPYFIKLLDFGIAQLRGVGAVEGLTVAGSVMGTPQYMSPEQVSGGAIDARADVWAMGVMMYRAATGQAPFKGEEFVDLANKILHYPPEPAGRLIAMPASLDALIGSCLQRRLEDRCASMDHLLAGLERVKAECRLDDTSLFSAVVADLQHGVRGPATSGYERSHGGASEQRYQVPEAWLGNPPAPPGPAAAAKRSRVAVLAAVGGAALALVGLALYLGAARPADAVAPVVPDASVVQAREPSIKELYGAGRAAEGRALAERNLRAALSGGSQQEQVVVVEALDAARVPAGAPLLTQALGGAPAVRLKAASALAQLGLRDAAPKVRAALSASGDHVKVGLAAAQLRLGDNSARPILLRALEDIGARLPAALALAQVGDAAALPVLRAVLDASPVGSSTWRQAARGALALGDVQATAALQGELSQEPVRAVDAASALAAAGDAAAREQLVRNVKDTAFSRRGEAALALARLGDVRALEWVTDGLASADEEERRQALASCAALAAQAAPHRLAIATLASDDVELAVRRTAEAVLLAL
jgi:serine/threonine protein kinase/HEAT repeat protein